MRSFLRSILDHALTLLERERPFFSLGSLSMYSLSLIAEIPVILARLLLVTIITAIVLVIENKSTSTFNWLDLALIPTGWSMLALITPFGSAWWWQTRAGGRAPSKREQLTYDDAVELLQAHTDTPLPLPKRWFVIDTPQPDAAVCGNALMLSRGLLETDHVPAVLAHELGHLGTPDGRLTAAINRLALFTSPFGNSTAQDPEQRDTPRDHQRPRQYRREAPQGYGYEAEEMLRQLIYGFVRFLFITSLIAKGGFGLWLTSPAWGAYWRKREYQADQYAAHLGQADELADFLEVHALIHDQPVPFIWLTEHTHPPTELRIDNLRNTTLNEQTPAQDTPTPATSDTRPLTA
jgi:Zn-dependent protease with chaperone function